MPMPCFHQCRPETERDGQPPKVLGKRSHERPEHPRECLPDEHDIQLVEAGPQIGAGDDHPACVENGLGSRRGNRTPGMEAERSEHERVLVDGRGPARLIPQRVDCDEPHERNQVWARLLRHESHGEKTEEEREAGVIPREGNPRKAAPRGCQGICARRQPELRREREVRSEGERQRYLEPGKPTGGIEVAWDRKRETHAGRATIRRPRRWGGRL